MCLSLLCGTSLMVSNKKMTVLLSHILVNTSFVCFGCYFPTCNGMVSLNFDLIFLITINIKGISIYLPVIYFLLTFVCFVYLN